MRFSTIVTIAELWNSRLVGAELAVAAGVVVAAAAVERLGG